MRFYCFHLMPWAYLPEDFPQRYDSAWITCPNSLYDPELGHPLYNRYLDELELADQLGFEGVCVNEPHQNAYGNMPSPNIMAACLARRTQHAKLAILGNVLPLYDHPQRVAEELAMLQGSVEAMLKARQTFARFAWQFPDNPKLASYLYRVKCPTLVVWGEADGMVPVSHGQAYQMEISDAALAVGSHCSHLPQVESPELLAATGSNYLEGPVDGS